MNIILKAIFLQFYWYLTVLYGPSESFPLFFIISLFLLTINWFVFKPNIDGVKFLMILFIFIAWGFIQDFALIHLRILRVDTFPYWMTSLWIVFLCYYGDMLNKFKTFNILLTSALGGLGGLASYIAGVRLSGLELASGQELLFYSIVFVSWALFFPVSINLFYKKSFLDKLLDLSVYFSFDRSGFKRHERFFKQSQNLDLKNKNVLVTGGTSGIGHSAAVSLKRLGANVYVTGRNLKKGMKVEKDGLKFLQLDLANWKEVKEFSQGETVFDHIVLNAGGMPESKEVNDEGVELQVASQLIGHYKLVKNLKENNKILEGTRIVWVSSGGMYLKKLMISELENNINYDKVDTYANVKRAQVTYVEELGQSEEWKGLHHYSMHPGWVDTAGIEKALPGFYKWTKNRLRSGKEGADTIVWLVASNSNLEDGAFYFDREKVPPFFSSKYNPDRETRDELISYVNKFSV